MEHQRFDTALLIATAPLARRMLRQALLAEGVRQVWEADDAADALTRMSSGLVQLVLTPWELADLSGRPLLQALRNRGLNRNVPVVLLDDGLPRASVIAAVKAGAAGRIALPATPEALRASVREVLERITAERSDSRAERPGTRVDRPPLARRSAES